MILLIFPSNRLLACTTVRVKYENLSADVCYLAETQSYFSKACKNIKTCFPVDKKSKNISQNQSPGFTQCYLVNGKAFFATVSNSTDKIPFCKLGNHWVDTESLLMAQKH